MSLKTFLSKLFGGIKKEIKALPQQVRDGLHIGITIVEGLKKAIESPAADILTAIIPGEWDDNLKGLLRQKLPQILTEMKLVDNCAHETDPEAIVKCALRELEKLTGGAKMNFLDSIATMVAQVAADGKLTLDDAKYLVKPYYDLIYKPKK